MFRSCLASLTLALLISGCSNTTSTPITHVPAQGSESSRSANAITQSTAPHLVPTLPQPGSGAGASAGRVVVKLSEVAALPARAFVKIPRRDYDRPNFDLSRFGYAPAIIRAKSHRWMKVHSH